MYTDQVTNQSVESTDRWIDESGLPHVEGGVAYSTTMKVGLTLPQAPEDGDGASWSEIADLARMAEDAGADSLWVCDHFLDRAPGREVGYHEP
jgi:hypothetical protein